MATIRVREWTKERLEAISEAESHSSHDSVIKSLLKDRELAQFAETERTSDTGEDTSTEPEPENKAFDDLTVLGELVTADNGVLFLWCPSCGNEIANIGLENPISMSVFEVKCQRCLTRLDQHAIVGIEIGYPIERRTVENSLQNDLQSCVVDYWDRTLELVGVGSTPADVDDEDHLVWQFDEYRREFGWAWPDDVPVIGVDAGRTYRNAETGAIFEVIDAVSDRPHRVDDVQVREYIDGAAHADGDGKTTVLKAGQLVDGIVGRDLYLEQSSTAGDGDTGA